MNKEKIAEMVRNNSAYYVERKKFAIFYNVKPYLYDGPDRYYGPVVDVFVEADSREKLVDYFISELEHIMEVTPQEVYEVDAEDAVLEQGILLFDTSSYRVFIEGDTVFELMADDLC